MLATLEHGAHVGHGLLDAGHILVCNSYILKQFLNALLQRKNFSLVPLFEHQGLLLELVKGILVEVLAHLQLVGMRVQILQFLLKTFLFLLQAFDKEGLLVNLSDKFIVIIAECVKLVLKYRYLFVFSLELVLKLADFFTPEVEVDLVLYDRLLLLQGQDKGLLFSQLCLETQN